MSSRGTLPPTEASPDACPSIVTVQLRPVPAPTDVLHQMSVCGVTSTQPGDTSTVPLLALLTAESTLVPAGPKLTPGGGRPLRAVATDGG